MEETDKNCPHCGYALDEDASTCPCGLSLEDMAVLRRALETVDAVAAKRVVKTKAVTVWTNRSDASVYGVTPSYAPLSRLAVERGTFFDEADELAASPVAVIGPNAARSLFGFEDPIGKALKIDKIWVTVIGVLAPKTFAKDEFEGVKLESSDNHIYVPVRTALRRLPVKPHENPLDEIVVALGDAIKPNEAALVIGEVMDRLHRLVDDWELVVPFELMEQSQKTQRIFNIVMGSIAGISLLVGGIGIMNIMLASVMERTREIGVRRAVGAHQGDVRVQFMLEALLLAVFGGALDQVAHAHDEFGLQQVQLAHGVGEDAGAVPPGAVGDDGELEVVWIVAQFQMGPGIHLLHRDPRFLRVVPVREGRQAGRREQRQRKTGRCVVCHPGAPGCCEVQRHADDSQSTRHRVKGSVSGRISP